MSNRQSRKYILTINNPEDNNFKQDKIKDILKDNFKSLIYYCMSDEIGGTTKTYHTHIFMQFSSPVRFNQIKRYFPTAHIENSRGTSFENRDYIFKKGKWKNSDKSETNLPDTHFELGTIPDEKPGRRTDLKELYQAIKDGLSNSDILEAFPHYMTRISDIDRTRKVIYEEKYRKIFREVKTTYIYGPTGIGKTRSIMETFGYENVFRVTDYKHPFDSYNLENVILFDEYNSNFRIQNMLYYLDGYPLEISARYSNKVAGFTKVFILSNLSLKQQYVDIQQKSSNLWKAFMRRINGIYLLNSEGFYPYRYPKKVGKRTLVKDTKPMSLEEVIESDFVTFSNSDLSK